MILDLFPIPNPSITVKLTTRHLTKKYESHYKIPNEIMKTYY
jgi:hypothetical protein